MKKKSFLLLKIILSAIFFSFSFLFIDQAGFLVIFSFVILFFLFKENLSLLKFSILGFIWGIIAFGLYFIWLLELLLNKSNATFFLATILYLLLICYSSILIIIFFNINRIVFNQFNKLIFQFVFFLLTTYLFFYFIEKHFLFFFEKGFGYPFLNPFIPLANYKFFLFLYSLFFNFYSERTNFSVNKFFNENKIIYLKPVVNSFDCKYNSTTVAQLIYKQLANLKLKSTCKRHLILVTPESFYPFSLNKNKKAIKLWSSVLPGNCTMFVCSQREDVINNSSMFFQTVYMLERGRIIDFYDKKHRVNFVEKIPNNLKKFKWSKNLFLYGKNEFENGKQKKGVFKTSSGQKITPQICSEFFYKVNLKFLKKQNIIFLFVNDSWFMNYFKKIMANMVNLVQAQIGHNNNILYVNYL